MNVISLTGRVKDDPIRKDTKNGVVAEWVLAVDGRDREWITVEVWGRLAGTCATHLCAGRRIGVTGELRSKQWNNRDGARQKTWFVRGNDVTFLDPPPNQTTADSCLTQATVASSKTDIS